MSLNGASRSPFDRGRQKSLTGRYSPRARSPGRMGSVVEGLMVTGDGENDHRRVDVSQQLATVEEQEVSEEPSALAFR